MRHVYSLPFPCSPSRPIRTRSGTYAANTLTNVVELNRFWINCVQSVALWSGSSSEHCPRVAHSLFCCCCCCDQRERSWLLTINMCARCCMQLSTRNLSETIIYSQISVLLHSIAWHRLRAWRMMCPPWNGTCISILAGNVIGTKWTTNEWRCNEKFITHVTNMVGNGKLAMAALVGWCTGNEHNKTTYDTCNWLRFPIRSGMNNNKSPDANVFGDDADLVWLFYCFFFFVFCERAHGFIRGFGYRYFVQCIKITQINTSLSLSISTRCRRDYRFSEKLKEK